MKKLSVALLLILLSLQAWAQLLGEEGKGNTWAVVYGISDYQEVNDLKFADRDASAFASYLTTYSNVPADNIRLRTNQDATTGNFWKDLTWLKEKSQKGDRAIIYFSGHGSKETQTSLGMGFLLTYNSPKGNYPAGAFGIQYLKAMVNDISQQGAQVLLITDACRSGMITENQLQGMDAATASLKEQFVNEVKILSCEPGQYSWEDARWGGGRSVFSYMLIEGLTGKADADGNGEITLLEIENYLESNVPREVAPKKQMPFAVGSKETVISIVTPGAGNLTVTNVPAQNGGDLQPKSAEEPSAEAAALEEKFKKAIDEGRLLMPMRDCADYYYQKLLGEESVAPKYSDYKLDLAGALQDASLTAYNTYAKSDSLDLARMYKSDENLTLYPAYLKRASDLLGKDHYLYNTLKSRELYFEGLLKRLEYFESGKDKEVLKEAIAKQEESLEFEGEQQTADAYFEMGVLQFDAEDYSNALLNFKKAIELAPEWAMPYDYLAGCYFMLKKYDDAETTMRKALEVAPEELQGYLKSNLAYVLEAKGQTEAAQDLYIESVELDGDDPRLQYELGMSYYDEKNYDEAAKIFRKLVEGDPNFQPAWLSLGITLRDAKKYDEAEVAFDKLLGFNPNDTRYLYEAGANYVYKNDLEKGRVTLEKLIGIDPNYTYAYDFLEGIYEKIGNSGEIDRLVQEKNQAKQDKANLLSQLKEQAFDQWNDFATTSSTEKREGAESACRQILEMNPADQETRWLLAIIYNYSNRFFEALDILEPITEKVSRKENPSLYYEIARGYLEIGEPKWALEELDLLIEEVGIEEVDPQVFLVKRDAFNRLGLSKEAQEANEEYYRFKKD